MGSGSSSAEGYSQVPWVSDQALKNIEDFERCGLDTAQLTKFFQSKFVKDKHNTAMLRILSLSIYDVIQTFHSCIEGVQTTTLTVVFRNKSTKKCISCSVSFK